jgi:hypothetical protein
MFRTFYVPAPANELAILERWTFRKISAVETYLNSTEEAETAFCQRSDEAMDTTIVSAMAAVLGSLVGGSASLATAWVTQKTLNRREVMGAEIRKREMLYGKFIHECSKLITDSLTHTLDKPETLLSSLCPAWELINRIRLSSSDAVLAEAENTIKRITDKVIR